MAASTPTDENEIKKNAPNKKRKKRARQLNFAEKNMNTWDIVTRHEHKEVQRQEIKEQIKLNALINGFNLLFKIPNQNFEPLNYSFNET